MTSAANSGNILMGLGLEAILAQFANSETYYQNFSAISTISVKRKPYAFNGKEEILAIYLLWK